jgi:hypothetical protein
MMVDFCIWVLETDGLQVAPFDQHSDGDGSLRAVGLNAVNWQSWLIRVANLQYEQRQVHRKPMLENPFNMHKVDFRSLLLPEAHNPPLAWRGDKNIGSRLVDLWEQYGPVSNERSKGETKFSRAVTKEEQKSGKRLYDELQPYYSLLPLMNIHFVRYPQPLDYLISPVSVVMTVTEGQPDVAEFRQRVLDAAAGLTSNGSAQRQKQTSYTLSPFSGPGAPKPMYKIYPRKPVHIVAPRPKVHIVADTEARQVILDDLSDDERSSWGEVNMETVQFLREKSIPGWQMHHVSFEETDGEKHSMVWIIKQENDGSWRVKQASSGGNFRETVSNFVAPVHDHPLLSFGGGANWAYTNNGPTQYELVAHGEIIDNGFDVTRVRLISTNGQVFEDIVQDELVLFVATQEQAIQLPMQAELYNAKGELVWRETVLDNHPPKWMKFRK